MIQRWSKAKLARALSAALLMGYLGAIGLAATCEKRLLFWPKRTGSISSGGIDIWLRAADGVKLHARYIARDPAAPTLLYLHGSAGNLASRSDRLELFSNLGANLLALEYRGYGQSSGTPSEEGLYRDAHAAYDWALERTTAKRVVLFGESLGGGPACEIASTRTVGGLILLSTFTSLPEVAARTLPWLPMRWIVSTRFNNLDKIARVSAPKLFIHGRADERVPFDMAEQLFAAAPAPKRQLWLARARHDETFYVERARATQAMAEFVSDVARR